MSGCSGLRLLCRLLVVSSFFGCLAACDRTYPSNDFEAAKEAARELDWAQSARLLQRYLCDEVDAACPVP